MEMSYGMVQQQVQRLVMTPQLRQAIQLLQLPTVDLAQYVQNELLQNPVLEEGDSSRDSSRDQDDGQEQGQEQDQAPSAGDDQIDWERYFAGDGGADSGWASGWADRDADDDPVRRIIWEPSLAERLHVELAIASTCPKTLRIGEYLLGCIDDSGFFRGDVRDVADALGAEEPEVEQVLKMIQRFDPVGVGSRSVQECLELQISARSAPDNLRALAIRIVREFLDDLAEGRIARIASQLSTDVGEVQEAADLIRALTPRPGQGYAGGGEVRYIVPDVIIEKVGDGYVVVPCDSASPRLVINNAYRSMLSDAHTDPAAKDFIRERLNSATWLIRALGQRRNTITRVATSIVSHQRDFFDRGILYLRPLTLREVAVDIEMHESTVSRATAGKYAQTPRGIFELRFFFGSGVSTSDGDAASAVSIKKYMKEVIASEDPRSPLSDQQIADSLTREGINISRRTVAKYRGELGMPASMRRRRY